MEFMVFFAMGKHTDRDFDCDTYGLFQEFEMPLIPVLDSEDKTELHKGVDEATLRDFYRFIQQGTDNTGKRF